MNDVAVTAREQRHAPRRSIKMLRSYAISACQQFSTSSEYITACLADDGLRRFRLDLLTGRITPIRYDYRRNRCLTDRVAADFQLNLGRFPHVDFAAAALVCDIYDANTTGLTEYRVTISAVDGRRWQGGIRKFTLGCVNPKHEYVIAPGDEHTPAIRRRRGLNCDV